MFNGQWFGKYEGSWGGSVTESPPGSMFGVASFVFSAIGSLTAKTDSFLPIDSNYYPYITKYGHYLMGYKYGKCGELKYLVYGIPGKRNFYDQPYGGKSGFVTWLPLDSRECGKNAMGYWIMFFDYKNYSVAIP